VLRDDVADAIFAMLTEPGHEAATYVLSGPEAITLGEAAALVSELGGIPTRYENETLEQARASRVGYGAPAWEVEGWITTYLAIAAGEFDVVTDHVERLTGRPPVGPREFLARSG
jgi:NAD(P)H dehydrogenase (quinone)